MARANASYARLPFAEAISILANKQAVDTNTYRDVTGIGHDAAFVVAGAKGALLNDLHTAVNRAVAEGETLAEFRGKFDQIVAQRGWSHTGNADWRATTIWRSNLRAAYAAGRIQAQEHPDVLLQRPFRQWAHGGTRSPRHSHLALDGKVYPSDHPFWQTSYPPVFQGRFEYGCRCQVYTLSQRDLDREGLAVEQPPALGDSLPWVDQDGNSGTVNLPPALGPGRAPGRTTAAERAQILAQITGGIHPAIAAQVVQAVEAIPLPVVPAPAAIDETVEVISELQQMPSIFKNLQVGSDKIKLMSTREQFEDGSLPHLSIMFDVNGSFAPAEVGREQKMRIMMAVKRAFKEEFARFPDGLIVENSPFGGEDGGRAKVYARVGFGPVDEDGNQWGIIKGGKIRPLTQVQFSSLRKGSRI